MGAEITNIQAARRTRPEPGGAPRRARPCRLNEAGPRRRPRLGLLLRALGFTAVALTVAACSVYAYFYWHYSNVVDERLASGYLTSRAGIYAAPRVLRTGQKLSPERLAAILRRAGYVDAGEAGRVWSGRFRVRAGGVEIEPAETSRAAAAQGFSQVRVEFDGRGHVEAIRADDVRLSSYALEPETLTNDAGVKTAGRDALAYADIPPVVARAILSIEDRRFFEHSGVDLRGVARAAASWWGVEEEGGRQGGSTITQQLVKNTYLSPERTLRRKLREAVLASVVERRLSKEEIFALYCNEIYLGQRGSVAVRGVQQAARVYFGKELKELSLAEAATIAGMIQSPGRYAPDRHPEQARARRNSVVAAMLRDGHVTTEEARAACGEPVEVVPASAAQTDAVAPHFIDYVNRAVEARGAAGSENAGDLRVYTTLDLELQQLAEEAVGNQLARLGKVLKGGRRPQAALVALDPKTGHVLAMVGGDDYAASQLNRATDARRQPGSVFKPVVFAAALENGVSPLTLSLDAPREFAYDRRARYRPANYGGGYSMREVTLRAALVRSLNVVTVETAMRAGLSRVASLAEKLGLPRPEPYPSLALGTTEATPLEVASAYTAFAAGGRVARPTPLVGLGAEDEHGLGPAPAGAQVLKPSTSFMVTDMLGAVIERGTARAARGALKGLAVAGKTGTARDGWFAGYTPNLVCVVWVGYDDGTELGLTGADSALPVWAEFVRRAAELRPELGGEYFERPDSVTTVEVDPETGLRAAASCPARERVAVTHALAPGFECLIHSAPLPMPALAEYVGPEPAAPAAAARVVTVPTLPPDRHLPAPASGGYDVASYDERPPTRATRVEVGRDGRRKLANELTVAPSDDEWRR